MSIGGDFPSPRLFVATHTYSPGWTKKLATVTTMMMICDDDGDYHDHDDDDDDDDLYILVKCMYGCL